MGRPKSPPRVGKSEWMLAFRKLDEMRKWALRVFRVKLGGFLHCPQDPSNPVAYVP